MEIVYFLVVMAVLISGVVVWAFLWSVKNGQFDDLEGPAHRILMDRDEIVANESKENTSGKR